MGWGGGMRGLVRSIDSAGPDPTDQPTNLRTHSSEEIGGKKAFINSVTGRLGLPTGARIASHVVKEGVKKSIRFKVRRAAPVIRKPEAMAATPNRARLTPNPNPTKPTPQPQ